MRETGIYRGVMPIQSEGARAPLRFLSQVDFECRFQKTKQNSRYFFSIFNTITPAWLDRSVRHIINCWIQICVRLTGAELDTDAIEQRCIITNHTRFCWVYECNDQSEMFRWVIAKMPMYSSLALWLNTSFCWNISSETSKCNCVY